MRSGTRFLRLLALVLAGSLLPSCRAFLREEFRSPKVRVADVGLAPGTENPWALLLKLAIHNPNRYPLDVTYVAYSANVGRSVLADGEHREEIHIGADGETFVDVPVTLRPDAFKEAARYVLQSRTMPYELNGSVGIRAPIVGTVRIPFSKTGVIDPVEILRRRGLGLN